MRTNLWSTDEKSHFDLFIICFLIAFVLEAITLTEVGRENHWLAHPQKSSDDSLIEAQIFQLPNEPHLVEEKKGPASSPHKEATLSKSVGTGKTHAQPNLMDEQNQTVEGPKMPPNHGAVPVYTPNPVIPPYLLNKELNTTVIIEFHISAVGVTTPRLVGSSGNEELDAIAVETAKRWQFRAAEKDHKPIESKVRLRLKFEVN